MTFTLTPPLTIGVIVLCHHMTVVFDKRKKESADAEILAASAGGPAHRPWKVSAQNG
jgi:hypothetical protein